MLHIRECFSYTKKCYVFIRKVFIAYRKKVQDVSKKELYLREMFSAYLEMFSV